MAQILTYGCKVNQYESQLIKENIEKDENFKDENIVIINSCCVTEKVEKEIKKKIKKLLKEGKKIFLTGCLAEKDTTYFKNLGNIEIVKKDFFYRYKNRIEKFNFHTRIFIKIEDGCENFCSYCIIPYVRGKIKSRKEEDIIEEIKCISENGYKEVVLTGIDLGSYGKDIGKDLKSLIEKIEKIDGIERIRLSSIEIHHINEGFIDFLKNVKKFCPHFHIPLQSGSDRILELMGRKYKFEEYFKKIEMVREKIKNMTFTTDIMVGFPGEKDEDFEKSCSAVEKIKFLKVHIFPYSEREFTSAIYFPDKIDEKKKKEREKILFEIADRVSGIVKREFIGKVLYVLFEREENRVWEGYTENYIPFILNSNENLKNKIVKVIPTKAIIYKNQLTLS